MPAAAPSSPPRTYAALQAGRGVAALLVTLYHLNGAIFRELGRERFWPGFSFGYAGVEFFFVLSGFIIAHVHWDDSGRREKLSGYLRKRAIRVYPTYWAVLALVVLLRWAAPAYAEGDEFAPGRLLRAALFLPEPGRMALHVAWTLRFELLFYLFFAGLLVHRRFGLALLGAWFAGCLLWNALGGGAFAGDFLFSAYNLLFAFGMAAAWAARRGPIPRPAALAAAGVLLFAAGAVVEALLGGGPRPWKTALFGSGSALLVAGLVELERRGRLRAPAALRRLGDASYSLYLVHFPAMWLLAALLVASGAAARLPGWAAFALLLAAALAAGLALHRLIERPLLRRARRES